MKIDLNKYKQEIKEINNQFDELMKDDEIRKLATKENDEIKEILNKLQKCKDYDDEVLLIKQYGATLILNCITNLQQKYDEANNAINWWSNKAKDLQQENEELKAQNTRYEVKMNCLIQENDILKENAEHNDKVVDKAKWNETIYKSRCEKAIEYLKECYSQPENIENFMTESEMNYLLNILQNGSDSQC